MTYSGVLATEVEIDLYAGENVDITGATTINKSALMLQAETNCVVFSKYDWVTNYGKLNLKAKGILSEYCARFTAVGLITFNMLGDGGNSQTRIESEDQLNIHLFRMNQIQKILENQDVVNYMT